MENDYDLKDENRNIEIRMLLEAVHLKYGYDFRNYSVMHTRRRVIRRLKLSGMASVSEMTHRVLNDISFFYVLLGDLSINVTEMFRDPSFYRAIRNKVVPHLATYPFIKLWHAGCSAGQEIYSTAILLKEEGLKERTQIYATDFNESVLETARRGIYPVDAIRDYTINYQAAGGRNSFGDYYTAMYGSAVLDSSLRDRVLFSQHNLVTDGVFGEMNMIFCRNVLIYFDKTLQNRVIKLFLDSLCAGGILCLGSRESLKFSDYSDCFETISEKKRIYRKRK